jgi:hypothetical protein
VLDRYCAGAGGASVWAHNRDCPKTSGPGGTERKVGTNRCGPQEMEALLRGVTSRQSFVRPLPKQDKQRPQEWVVVPMQCRRAAQLSARKN